MSAVEFVAFACFAVGMLDTAVTSIECKSRLYCIGDYLKSRTITRIGLLSGSSTVVGAIGSKCKCRNRQWVEIMFVDLFKINPYCLEHGTAEPT